MTYIDEMIKELCPDGVEWKELGEVVDYEQPTKYIVKSKEYSDDYSVPVLTAGQTFILGYTNEETGIYPASKEHSVIIFDDFTTARKWVDFEFKVKSSAMKILSIKSECQDEVSIRYVWHYLGTIKYAPEQHARQWIGIFSKFKIPLPPLEIQQEIVKILDKFTEYVTELTAELTAELTLRQKQYSYYRDRLLSFEDQVYQVEWKTLGEVCDVRDGTHDSPKKKNFGKYLITSKNIKCGSVTFENAYYISDEDFELINKRSKVDVDDLLFTMIGTVGEIAHIIDEPDFAIKNVGLIKTRDRILARYLFHYLQSSVAKKYIADNKSKGSQVFLALGKIRNFPIPYVPSDIQSRIVQVLDNFDTVCNDLNIGLPKEIELRQKQYDFFRDQLLTFTAEGVYTDSTVQYSTDKT
ncbi:TPA: restriction endonuclease subunit S [Streptococcus suis]|uniref:restriction endonuclease subunit S n=1 Tax=Streptococcus suis TaxID=1307 RepID=UPI0005CEF9AF|nr:restriction endonuclease subunit S [Streptococcus suis]NQS67549.1 restriction endonuclease subunit S [Streptococcus suis]CYW84131.1 type I restriction-modification system S protein [Streptococcus suis]HEM4764674.1 restriction endonuclease subunit S [Streptococcus suis]HEM4886223.1 restriction endonuclease subunit S [Streptococcus suis]